MKNNDVLLLPFYYPICKIKGCDGVLNFKRNVNNFSIQYICEKNCLHNNENIKYNDFMEYLKVQNFENHSKKCTNHDKSISNFCNDCKKYICDICLQKCK